MGLLFLSYSHVSLNAQESSLEESFIAEKMLNVLEKVVVWNKPIPGTDPKECGNYKEHDLEAAKTWASKWVSGIKEKGYSC